MAVNEQLKKLVDQMPDPNGKGMLTSNVDKEKTETAVAAIAEGGRENVAALIRMLGPAGSRESAKPLYALHCVINHTLVVRDQKRRKELCEAIAAQLANENLLPENRAFLCQELQWAGHEEACGALGKVLLTEGVSDDAATALIAIGGESAAAELRRAVKEAKGKARLNLMDALAALSDPKSLATFRKGLQDKDREVRIAAAAGLAGIGQGNASELLLKAAASAKGWERAQLTKSCLVLAEKLAAGGNMRAATLVYKSLQDRTGDNEKHVREAAKRGLAAIDERRETR